MAAAHSAVQLGIQLVDLDKQAVGGGDL